MTAGQGLCWDFKIEAGAKITMISIVIPVYNLAPCLRELHKRIDAALSGREFEIIFINDGSRDDSMAVLREVAQEDSRVKVLSLSRNFGQHPATGAGLEVAQGDQLVIMDGDLQDLPEDIPALLERLKDGVEIVYTIKSETRKSFLEDITSRLFHYTHAKLSKINTPKNIGTFRAFTRKFHKALLKYKEYNITYGPLMLYMGFSSAFYQVNYFERSHGKSSYGFFRRLKLAINSLVTYTDIPYRLLITLGSVAVTFSSILGLLTLLQYMIVGRVMIGGLTVIIMVNLLLGGTVITAVGLLGMYIFRIFQEVLGRPRCLVAERINLDQAEPIHG
jgi:dolichol-phosphate mannosyltransferase